MFVVELLLVVQVLLDNVNVSDCVRIVSESFVLSLPVRRLTISCLKMAARPGPNLEVRLKMMVYGLGLYGSEEADQTNLRL